MNAGIIKNTYPLPLIRAGLSLCIGAHITYYLISLYWLSTKGIVQYRLIVVEVVRCVGKVLWCGILVRWLSQQGNLLSGDLVKPWLFFSFSVLASLPTSAGGFCDYYLFLLPRDESWHHTGPWS